jgi:transposase
MDVDQEKIAVAVLVDYEAEAQPVRMVANSTRSIEKFFRRLCEQYETVFTCYEASGCGFVLYRQLIELGVGCQVIAPSSVPKRSGDRVKTDRRDARRLALGLRNGDLSAVYVPSRDDEAVRDYLRLYEDVKSDLKRAKQRLIHFLHRRGIRYTEGSKWTQRFWRWIDQHEFPRVYEQESFEEYIEQVQRLEEKRSRVAGKIEQIAGEERYQEAVGKLKALKGIGTLIALTMVVEICDFRRFASAQQFMAFLGLVPSEHSSGSRRRVGSITKAGNSHLRKLLVEASWHARSYHPHSRSMRRAREGLSAEVVNYAHRAGRRLTKKYWKLLNAHRPPQIAATAVARELAGFVWGLMVGKTA